MYLDLIEVDYISWSSEDSGCSSLSLNFNSRIQFHVLGIERQIFS